MQKILIVEDDLDIQELLQNFLQDYLFMYQVVSLSLNLLLSHSLCG